MEKSINVSVVIPLYNEEGNVVELYRELKGVLNREKISHEILLINDGSSDRTTQLISELHSQDPCVTVINFRRNFGQTAAMSAGFDYARGDVIVTMDGDLQNDPADIPVLLAKIAEGNDVVTGWRFARKDPFISRKFPSMIANKIISFITGVHLHDYGCTLKAFKKEITQHIKLYGEMHRFIPAIASGMGACIAEVKVNHRARKYGASKYGISRTVRVILDLVTVKFLLSYSNRPLHVFGLIGMISSSLGFFLLMLLGFQRQCYGIPMGDRPMLMMAVLLIFIGVQFVTIGLISEIQVRTYHESQSKPIYYVKNILREE
ncbi:MAG: glycosyltransferase family 2 protein [Deltaproteobacteria bacterium]|nr:glycosyltransferase family 2 protein [Deltaproteobacteria bacterium]